MQALVRLRGVSLLRRCVDGLLASGVVDLVVVVAAPELVDTARADLPSEVLVVAGGAERSDSVRARALTPPELVVDAVRALRAGAVAVVPALPVADTTKSVDDQGVVTGTPDRSSLRAVQTPQGFTVDGLRAAHAGTRQASDDAGLVERAGSAVRTVPGHPLAFKITTATDLALAEVLLEALS